jgi:hypothetical protein
MKKFIRKIIKISTFNLDLFIITTECFSKNLQEIESWSGRLTISRLSLTQLILCSSPRKRTICMSAEKKAPKSTKSYKNIRNSSSIILPVSRGQSTSFESTPSPFFFVPSNLESVITTPGTSTLSLLNLSRSASSKPLNPSPSFTLSTKNKLFSTDFQQIKTKKIFP